MFLFKPFLKTSNNLDTVVNCVPPCFCSDSAALYYPFYMKRMNFEITHNGWQLFNLLEENKKLIQNSDSWRVCGVNSRNEVTNRLQINDKF